MTLTKKDNSRKVFIDTEASARKQVAAEKSDDLSHSKVEEKARTDCNCAVQNAWVDIRENVNDRPRNASSKRGSKQGMSTTKLKVEDINVLSKDAETKLDLENIDAESLLAGTESERGSTRKESNELLSRRSTVKSNRPTTKPVLLRKFSPFFLSCLFSVVKKLKSVSTKMPRHETLREREVFHLENLIVVIWGHFDVTSYFRLTKNILELITKGESISVNYA